MAIDYSAHGSLAPFLSKYSGLFGLYPEDDSSIDEVIVSSSKQNEREHETEHSVVAISHRCLKSPTTIRSCEINTRTRSTNTASTYPPPYSHTPSPWTAIWERDATPTLTESSDEGGLDDVIARIEAIVQESSRHLSAMRSNPQLSLPRRVAQKLTDLRTVCEATGDDYRRQWHQQHDGSPKATELGGTPRDAHSPSAGLGQSPRLWVAHFRALCTIRMQMPSASSHLTYGLIALVAAQSAVSHLLNRLSSGVALPAAPSPPPASDAASTVLLPPRNTFSPFSADTGGWSPIANGSLSPEESSYPCDGSWNSPRWDAGFWANPGLGASSWLHSSPNARDRSAGTTPGHFQLVLSPLSTTLPTKTE